MNPMAEPPIAQPCAQCAKAATKACRGCTGAPLADGKGTARVAYCDAVCQKAHWPKHKTNCKITQARRTLYRAGETAQQAFYLYREFVFDMLIETVESNENALIVHHGNHETYPLVPFPHSLFSCEKDKHMMLSWIASDNAVGYMHDLISGMLEGIYSKIEEIYVHPKNPRRRVIMFDSVGHQDNNPYCQLLIRVILFNGETYAFDIASAQFGYHDSIVPWRQYFHSRVVKVLQIQPFSKKLWELMALIPRDPPALDSMHRLANKSYVFHFVAGMSRWVSGNTNLAVMFRLPEHEFCQKRSELFASIEKMMRLGRYNAGSELTMKLQKPASASSTNYPESAEASSTNNPEPAGALLPTIPNRHGIQKWT